MCHIHYICTWGTIKIWDQPALAGWISWSVILYTKRLWFDPQSGQITRLWVWALVGQVREATGWCSSLMLIFLSLCFSLSSLSKNNKHILRNIYTHTHINICTHMCMHACGNVYVCVYEYMPIYKQEPHWVVEVYMSFWTIKRKEAGYFQRKNR